MCRKVKKGNQTHFRPTVISIILINWFKIVRISCFYGSSHHFTRFRFGINRTKVNFRCSMLMSCISLSEESCQLIMSKWQVHYFDSFFLVFGRRQAFNEFCSLKNQQKKKNSRDRTDYKYLCIHFELVRNRNHLPEWHFYLKHD